MGGLWRCARYTQFTTLQLQGIIKLLFYCNLDETGGFILSEVSHIRQTNNTGWTHWHTERQKKIKGMSYIKECIPRLLRRFYKWEEQGRKEINGVRSRKEKCGGVVYV